MQAQDFTVGNPQARAFDGRKRLRRRWRIATRENIFDQPRRRHSGRRHTSDRVEQAHAVVRQEVANFGEELIEMALADVLEHPDGDDAIVLSRLFAIIEQLELHLVVKTRRFRPRV